MEPKFIICDEPVSALDVSVQAQIINLLQELQEKLTLTYLFIAHDLAVVEHISNRVLVMYYGKIVEEASAEDIYRNSVCHPLHESAVVRVPTVELSEKRPRIIWPPLGTTADQARASLQQKKLEYDTKCGRTIGCWRKSPKLEFARPTPVPPKREVLQHGLGPRPAPFPAHGRQRELDSPAPA